MNLQFWSFQPDIWRATSPNPYKVWAIPEKTKQGGLRTYFFEKPLEFFHFLNFAPGNSRQNKVPTLEIPQIFARSLGSSKAKNQDPWKFHILFFWSPLEIPYAISLIPLEIPGLYYILLYIATSWQIFVKFWHGSCPSLKDFSQFGAEWPQEQFKSLIVESWRPCAVLSLNIVL